MMLFSFFVVGCVLLALASQWLFESWLLGLFAFLGASAVFVFVTGLVRINVLLVLFSGGDDEIP